MSAILAAIVLAMLSPSVPDGVDQPGKLAEVASPTPAASIADTRRPTTRPTIVSPSDRATDEFLIAMTVDVPDEGLPRNLLSLVVLRGDEELKVLNKPKLGRKVVIEDVPLLERSVNELTVALKTEAGHGPRSAPVLLTQDPDAPTLAITAPADGDKTYDRTIEVRGTSEVGAEVTFRNETNGIGPLRQTVGDSGEFEKSVRLKVGKNRIVVESKDETGLSWPPQVVRVTRIDGKPRFEVEVKPKRIKKSSPPKTIKVVVTVTDGQGEPMADADVAYTLGSLSSPIDTHGDITGPDGKSIWRPDIAWSSSLANALQLGLTVTSPHGETVEDSYDIPIS